MANIELLRRVADYIEEHPDRYDQSSWLRQLEGEDSKDRSDVMTKLRFGQVRSHVCQTQACVAGNAVLIGAVDEHDTRLVWRKESRLLWDRYTESEVWADVERLDWETSGAALLDLDESVACWLFSSGRDEAAMPNVLRMLAALEECNVLDEVTIGVLSAFELYQMQRGEAV